MSTNIIDEARNILNNIHASPCYVIQAGQGGDWVVSSLPLELDNLSPVDKVGISKRGVVRCRGRFITRYDYNDVIT